MRTFLKKEEFKKDKKKFKREKEERKEGKEGGMEEGRKGGRERCKEGRKKVHMLLIFPETDIQNGIKFKTACKHVLAHHSVILGFQVSAGR